MAEQFRQADVSDVQEVSRMFEGKEFCVVNGPRELPKQDIERKIAEVNVKCVYLVISSVQFVTSLTTMYMYLTAIVCCTMGAYAFIIEH